MEGDGLRTGRGECIWVSISQFVKRAWGFLPGVFRGWHQVYPHRWVNRRGEAPDERERMLPGIPGSSPAGRSLLSPVSFSSSLLSCFSPTSPCFCWRSRGQAQRCQVGDHCEARGLRRLGSTDSHPLPTCAPWAEPAPLQEGHCDLHYPFNQSRLRTSLGLSTSCLSPTHRRRAQNPGGRHIRIPVPSNETELKFLTALLMYKLLNLSVCSVSQSCPTPCNSVDCILPSYSVHGIFQTRILKWVAIPSSRGSSWPRDRTCVSCISCIGRQTIYH